MSNIRCAQCGLVNFATAEICKRCGAHFIDVDQNGEAWWSENALPFDLSPQQTSPPSYAHAGQTYAGHNTYTGYSHAGYSHVKKSKGMAVAALILAILSAITFGLLGIGAVLGLILGIVALKRARKNPALYGGEGQAIAAIVISSISVLMFLYVATIAAIAIPNLLASRKAANEASAISSLRTINSAEATFQATTGAGRFGSMEELAHAGLIDQKLASGFKHGYKFEIKTGEGAGVPSTFEATAKPETYGEANSSGNRSFYISEDGVIHVAKGTEVNASDPPLEGRDMPSQFYERETRRTSYSSPY